MTLPPASLSTRPGNSEAVPAGELNTDPRPPTDRHPFPTGPAWPLPHTPPLSKGESGEGEDTLTGFDNDPSAGSPTETLLRLLLPLNDKVQWTSRDVDFFYNIY